MSDVMAAMAGTQNMMMDVLKIGWGMYSQNKTWEREDTAVQRRVRDLEAAGMNPVLAAGSAAQTGQPVSFGQPQGDAIAQTMAVLKMKQEISTTKAQEDYLVQQARVSSKTADLLEKTEGTKVEQQEQVVQENAIDIGLKEATKESNIARSLAEVELIKTKVDVEKLQLAVDRLYKAMGADLANQKAAIDVKVSRKYSLAEEEQRLLSLTVAAKAAQYSFDWSQKSGMQVGNPGILQGLIGTVMQILRNADQAIRKW